jgi:hypothetical protein
MFDMARTSSMSASSHERTVDASVRFPVSVCGEPSSRCKLAGVVLAFSIWTACDDAFGAGHRLKVGIGAWLTNAR